jgi:hypothetical protein
MSVQYFAAASQKFTCPTVTGVDLDVTAAVSVTTLPGATVVTVIPAEVMVRDVVVEAFACADAIWQFPQRATTSAIDNNTCLLNSPGQLNALRQARVRPEIREF